MESVSSAYAIENYDDDQVAAIHDPRYCYQRCDAILDELQASPRRTDFAIVANVWMEHHVPLIVSTPSSSKHHSAAINTTVDSSLFVRPVPCRVSDADEEDCSGSLEDGNASTITQEEIAELRAEGARNPFGEEEYSAAQISVNTQLFLHKNSSSLFIKPVALRATDLVACDGVPQTYFSRH